ncbi:MAG: DNA polymerase III subunit gamma/tau [Lachnospiraceae bacterium]|nr:DNA polymerase III subunit gamma/tau [Lachnospiraceae bacterium]MDD3796636.1 DNA polymerase III subunit gamma/tau [Lachnospiraceae bacterium]
MSYTALYRKFRPDTFEEVKGQDAIVTTLKNQIRADRIGHAYLFCGTRGTGKTTVAKIFARAVNCEQPVDGNPCGVCSACRGITAGTSMNVIEIDAASNNGVDNIREIRDEVAYSPTEGKYKVYIIDEVHMLSMGAFNALLKTLEEPPSYVIFILATTEAHKIPVTILSRCQRYDFKRITQLEIGARLQDLLEREQVEAEEKAIHYIAKKADGGMRDALSLADQCISFYLGQKLTYEKVLEVLGAVDTEVFSHLLRMILKDDVAGLFASLEELIMQGRDLTQLVNDFTWYLRNLMLLKASDQMDDALDVSAENLLQLKEEAAMIREDTLMRFIRIFSELANQIRYSSNKRVLLEVALIKLCRPEAERDEQSLLERIRRLEKQIETGSFVPQGLPAGSGAAQAQRDAGAVGAVLAKGAALGQPMAEGNPGGSGGNYQKAVPKDLQQIRTMWNSIIADTSARFKVVLSSAQLKFNTASEDSSQLFVVFSDFLGETYINDISRKEELEQAIAEKTGKKTEVKFILSADENVQNVRLQRIDVEEAIRDFIHMDVETEEE